LKQIETTNKQSRILIILITILISVVLSSCGSQPDNPWILFEDENGKMGYVDLDGDTTIATGKYQQCYTDTFNTYCIVYKETEGLVAINRDEEVLFNVFPYDNGPDYPSDGLFRIVQDDKIGYADLKGKIVIEPQYPCAYPFENGKSKVSLDCSLESEGEHSRWVSENWLFIDKRGRIIP